MAAPAPPPAPTLAAAGCVAPVPAAASTVPLPNLCATGMTLDSLDSFEFKSNMQVGLGEGNCASAPAAPCLALWLPPACMAPISCLRSRGVPSLPIVIPASQTAPAPPWVTQDFMARREEFGRPESIADLKAELHEVEGIFCKPER